MLSCHSISDLKSLCFHEAFYLIQVLNHLHGSGIKINKLDPETIGISFPLAEHSIHSADQYTLQTDDNAQEYDKYDSLF